MIEIVAIVLLLAFVLLLVPEFLEPLAGMDQRNFDLLMTMIQVFGGGVIAGVIAWWAVKAGAAAALKYERELRAEEQRIHSAAALATNLLEVRKLITQARDVLAQTVSFHRRFESARDLMSSALLTFAPAWRDHLHALRGTPLQPHLENIADLAFYGGLSWFTVPNYSQPNIERISDQLERFEKYVTEVIMDLTRLRRGDQLEGITHPYTFADATGDATSDG